MTKLRNIEFLRIIFCMAIVYLHIFNCQMSNFIQNTHDNNIIDLFNKMAFNCSNGWLLVQGFVMIAGFFLFYSIKKKGNMPWGKFALDKLVRLYSVMAFYTLLCVLLHICGIVNLNFYTLFLNLITFQCIGVNNDFIGITWFISPFFWTMLLVFGMYKTFDNKYFHFFIAVLMYFSYVVLTKYGYGRETIGLGLNLAVVKMFAALITGYFIGMFHNKVKTANIFNEHKILTFMWFSIAEIISFVCIINWTLFHKISYTNNFIFMPIFVILIFCFVMNKGLLSQVTNIKLFEILGQYSYSIYVMQQIAFWLLKVYFWKNTDFLQNHFALTIVLSLIFTLILGIVTYYIIERPMIIWYKNLKFYDGGGG